MIDSNVPSAKFRVIGNGNRDGGIVCSFLHRFVTVLTSDLQETLAIQDRADLSAGKDT
jgi:hypothetical protein